MRKFIGALSGLVFVALGVTSLEAAERRVALVIGESAYKGAPLENPTVDADLISDALKKIGFEVRTVKNADLGAFDKAVTAFSRSAEGADVALFYFAGHGFTVNEGVRPVSLLMSTSADVSANSERVLRSGGIPLDEIIEPVASKAKATLVFVDACRNDPRVSRGVGGEGRGFARQEPLHAGGGVFVGLSTRLGDTAQDGEAGKGSPFARAFVTRIGAAGSRIDDAFRSMRDDVRTATDGKQSPEFVQNDLPNGAITLVKLEATASGGPSEDPRLAEAAQVWATVGGSGDADALTLFAQRYQGTIFADLAEAQRKKAEAAAARNAVAARPSGDPVVVARPTTNATECDRLAAAPDDPRRPAGISGVAMAKIDFGKAIPACKGALSASPGEPRLMTQLARAMLRSGTSSDEAIQLLRRAADQGEVAAMTNLAVASIYGLGGPRDDVAGVGWYKKAADAGSAAAMWNYGAALAAGRGTRRDEGQAFSWFKKSAEAGDSTGMRYLAAAYMNGAGAKKNPAEAYKWFRASAEAGDGPGMYRVGFALEHGEGVLPDLREAADWYRKAADAGEDAARSQLKRLGK